MGWGGLLPSTVELPLTLRMVGLVSFLRRKLCVVVPPSGVFSCRTEGEGLRKWQMAGLENPQVFVFVDTQVVAETFCVLCVFCVC